MNVSIVLSKHVHSTVLSASFEDASVSQLAKQLMQIRLLLSKISQSPVTYSFIHPIILIFDPFHMISRTFPIISIFKIFYSNWCRVMKNIEETRNNGDRTQILLLILSKLVSFAKYA